MDKIDIHKKCGRALAREGLSMLSGGKLVQLAARALAREKCKGLGGF